MEFKSAKSQFDIITSNIEEVLPEEELLNKLKKSKKK